MIWPAPGLRIALCNHPRYAAALDHRLRIGGTSPLAM